MDGLGEWMGRRLPRRGYHLLRSLMEHAEARFDKTPTSLPALSHAHTAGAELLPDRTALLERLTPGGTSVEIGVDQGHFSADILRLAAPAKLHLVDAWGSARYGKDKQAAVAERFASEGARVELHLGLSTERVTDFADGSLDFVYIDTDHSYALTKEELRLYAPKVAPGGLLAGHDYSMGNWRKRYRYGVMEAVQEFCVEEGWGFRYLTAEIAERQSFALVKLPQGSADV